MNKKEEKIQLIIKPIIIMPRGYWHIRKYFKSGHGALIVGESGTSSDDEYGFLNITKNPPKGYSYMETEKPINKGEENSFVRLYLQKGKKKRFSKWTMKFEISNSDLDKIEKYLNQKRKKR